MSDLKPCPFCGKSLAVVQDTSEDEDAWEQTLAYSVVCDATIGGCGGSSGYDTSEEDVIDKWNRRYIP